ncbi:MAG: imidazole glycerol phosphate synthase subunit HisH [Opitutales bacterium]
MSDRLPEARPKIAVIDYGMGNLRSVCKALEHTGAEPLIARTPRDLNEVHGIVFPGQGALGDCVLSLKESGLDEAIRNWITADKPFFGICLGLQALFEYSEEGDSAGLAIFPGRVVRFRLPPLLKIPHMGWNTVHFRQPGSPLIRGMNMSDEAFYFVHSYYVVCEDPAIVLCTTDYGGEFVSGVGWGNCFAVQFHPEKSQARGLLLYQNFVGVVRSYHQL